MDNVDKLRDEEGRLLALQRYQILETSEEDAFEHVVNLVQNILNVPMCAISLVEHQRQWFKAKRGIEMSETPRDVSFCAQAIKDRNPLVIQDATSDPRFSENPLVTGEPHIRSYAGIPLRTPDGYNIGSLCAIDTKPRLFTPFEVSILDQFAKIVVGELELRQIASSDHLSGAMSRGAWMEGAGRELERAKRYNRPLALALFDLDRFKEVNDSFGHPAGDEVIRTFAALCTSESRDLDLFGRIGGEEFALLMPETDFDLAERVAERCRNALETTPVAIGDHTLRVTTSAGLASFREQDSLKSLIARADAALFSAKAAGRNRVAIAAKDSFGADSKTDVSGD